MTYLVFMYTFPTDNNYIYQLNFRLVIIKIHLKKIFTTNLLPCTDPQQFEHKNKRQLCANFALRGFALRKLINRTKKEEQKIPGSIFQTHLELL